MRTCATELSYWLCPNLPFIERVCSRYFRKVGQRWYLRGEPVGWTDSSPQLIEEEVAIKEEVSAIEWLRQRVKMHPMLIGELKPLWMRATGLLPEEASRDLILEDLLAENFWRDRDTNRWREPTPEERERINDDRSIRVLHDAERFVAGSLRRSSDDSERCEWIDGIFEACKAIEAEGTAPHRRFVASIQTRVTARLPGCFKPCCASGWTPPLMGAPKSRRGWPRSG